MSGYRVNFETLEPDLPTYPTCWINFCDKVREDDDFVSRSGGMHCALTERLKSIGIKRIKDPAQWVILEFESEADFLVFKLRWG